MKADNGKVSPFISKVSFQILYANPLWRAGLTDKYFISNKVFRFNKANISFFVAQKGKSRILQRIKI